MTNKRTGGERTRRKVAGRCGQDTAEFDREFVADAFRPPSPQARAKWRKPGCKRGRPPEGRGAKVVPASIEKGLLERSDKLARQMGITRPSG
ncbi:MAG: hypothetical protein JW741_08755 [Sedimentisphaerales bacterium]|nr:hypothetical protein [Sedimentisphaerales bacterium]